MNDFDSKPFEQIRSLFPHTTNISYFNSASYGPFCTPVADAVKENLELRMRAARDDSHDAFELRESLRADYASLIGTSSDNIGIGLNTTHGLNIAAFGLELDKGSEILLSDIEFPALVYTFKAAAERFGYNINFIKSTDRKYTLEDIEQAITPKTKLLALSYVHFFNGYKNDLKAIADLCKSREIYFIVDGIQGMGVEPLDVEKLGVDLFTSGCQKWLLSPQGCGFFYLSPSFRDKLRHPFMSWLGVDWNVTFTDLFRYELPYFETAERFELGYYAVLNLHGMKAAVELFTSLGIPNIRHHNHVLIDRLAAFIENHPYYTITSEMSEPHRSSIFTFSCDRLEELHRAILDEKIILVRREGSIRVSVHLFNNEADIDRLISVLEQFAV